MFGTNRIFETVLKYVWDESKIRTCPKVQLGRPGKEGGGGEAAVRVARVQPFHLSFSPPNLIVARMETVLLVGHCGSAGEGRGSVSDVVPLWSIYVGVSEQTSRIERALLR